ncbi:geranylgeranylglyceryl/heptaprenylglyceryl phosphate synthase [Candidatus Latescibacterota bacterium]
MAFSDKPSVYEYLLNVRKEKGAGFLILVDPDRASRPKMRDLVRAYEEAGVDAILVGTSLMMADGFDEYVGIIKDSVSIPVIIFPGEKSQVTRKADAILFLSLLSGRNPDLLIGEQIKSAPIVRAMGLEAIATAYLLIDSGRITSVEYMSNTRPIPSDKPDIAVAHALAAEIFGMKLVYLEAGSGAEKPVPDDMIRAVSSSIDIPVIVGGGIRSPETVAGKVEAGASFVVVGNHLENMACYDDLAALIDASRRGR